MGHRAVRVAEIDDVDHELAELGQLFRSIDGPGGQDPLEELVRVGDPLPPDQLVGVIRDRQGVVEVDLLVALGQRRGGQPRSGPEIGIAFARWRSSHCCAIGGNRCLGGEFAVGHDGVVVGPDEVVRSPSFEREQPAPALAVDGVGEADRGQVGQPAQQRRAVDVLRPVEPFEIGGAEGESSNGLGR